MYSAIKEIYANDNLLSHEAIDEYEVYDTFDKAREAIIQYILRGESIVWNSFLRNIEENHEEFLRGLRMDNEKVGPYSLLNRYVWTISVKGGSSKSSPRFTETHVIQEVAVK